MDRANCAGLAPNKRLYPDQPDPWFPGQGESLVLGKVHCYTCEVRPECKDYSIRTESHHGMWAGEIERKEK